MAATNELQLLAEAISTNGEAESNGVKYIYMDDSTVYRFENNRMKKVSTTLLKKARTLISSQDKPKQQPKAKTSKKSRVKQEQEQEQEQDEPEPEQDEPEQEPEQDEQEQPKRELRSKPKTRIPKTTNPTSSTAVNIDLNEYYNNKNKMEYMMKEMDRLNNKVNKLKQYKSIVNRITGGEYDQSTPEPTPVSYATTRRVRDDLFS